MALADTILVPGVYVTVDNSLANTALGESFKTVLIGQKTSAGTATAETFVQVFSEADANEKFGVGSILANMFSAWFANNKTDEVYAVALDDNTGTKATATITVSGTATSSGTLHQYVNGVYVPVSVASGDSETDVADAIVVAISADSTLPVTATNVAGAVTYTAKNEGTVGNEITIGENLNSDQSLPSGITWSFGIGNPNVKRLSGGATDPDVNDAIAAIPDEVVNLFINPYTDSTSLTALDTELTRRWGNTVQLDGHVINSYAGTTAQVTTQGDSLNSEHLTFIDGGFRTATPPYLLASGLGARVSRSASVDPARPFRTLPLTGAYADLPTDRRTFSEKSSILNSGIGTHNVTNDGTVTIDRLITTYKTNALGAADTSYQNTNTMFNLSFMRQSFKTRMLSRYPRHKLADDGTSFGAGQPIATPSSIKGEIIALYEEWIALGLAEDVDTFAETLTVERDAVNRSRVNVTMQPILVGQLYQFDTTLQFIV
jgi:phage tail sheath gpL-like